MSIETITYSQVQELVMRLPVEKLPIAYRLLVDLSVSDTDLPSLQQNFMLLPVTERRRLMAEQAKQIMDHARLATAPKIESVVEVFAQYNRGARAAIALADWIRNQGYEAEGHSGPQAGPVNMIPAALAYGFGELGKHGSIINRQYGASFRLACVLTDLPLIADSPDEFGAEDFCQNCKLCTKACPPRAIFEEKQLVSGEMKWYVDFDKCIPYFNDTFGCAICIGVCPWSRPGVAPNLARKMLLRRSRRSLAS